MIDICVDFDGTIVEHCFPEIGEFAPHAIDTLKWLQDFHFVNLILLTMRSTWMYNSGDYLTDAVNLCKSNGINFVSINENLTQDWTISRKVYGKFYIDDTAIGCPLILPPGFKRECVDWLAVKNILTIKFKKMGLLE